MATTHVSSRVRTGVLIAMTALTTACGGTPTAPAAEARNEAVRLQRATALLQRQVELAASKEFYLVFDPAKPDLALKLRGAELRRFGVLGAQVGVPRVAWFGRGASRAWQGVVWTSGALEPARQIDRVVVQGGEPGKGETEVKAPPIPPTAEELYPVPSRYLIRFADGLSVEIRPREADTNLGIWARTRAWAGAKGRDVVAALFSAERDAVRLRLVLNPADAESLYRALPPSVRLLVL